MSIESLSPMEMYFPKKAGYMKSVTWKILPPILKHHVPRKATDLFGFFDQDGDLIMICGDLESGQEFANKFGHQLLTLQ